MKLSELLPVGKLTPRKPLNETIDISSGKEGVYVAVDDNDDVIFVGRTAGLRPEELEPIIDALSKTRWFVKLVVSAAKRKVERINVEFSSDGIKFR